MGPARTSIRLLLAAIPLLFGVTQVQAVGLGDIQVESFLNQHLKAKVWLLGLSKAEARKYTVSLGSEADFRRSNIPFPTVLGTVRLRMSVRDTKPYVRVLTTSPVREPFLRILISLKGPEGKFQKEYAVLLDPQGFDAASQSSPVAVASPGSDAEELPDFTQASPRKSPGRSTAARSPGSRTARSASSDTAQYGPVKSNESLWSIAQRLRPDESVSMQQMMIALLNANPDAFDGSNINTLRKGSVLQVPGLAAIRRLDAITAFREAKRQIEGPRRVSPGEGPKPAAGKRVAVGDIQIEVTDTRSKTAASTVDSRTRAEQSIAAKARALEAELLGTLEPVVPVAKEASMEMAAVDDSRKASMDMDKAPVDAEPPSGVVANKEASMALWQPGVTSPLPGADVDESLDEGRGELVADKPAQPLQTPDTGAVTEKVGKVAAMEKPVSQLTDEPVVNKTPPKPAKPKAIVPARIAPPPVVEPVGAFDGIMDQLFADPVMLAMAGGGLVGILALIMLILRRRQAGSDDDGYLDDENATIMAESADVDDAGADPNAATTVMSASDADGDVLTSAQEYMDNNQLDDASRILEQAVMAEPSRDDLRMKLAEVYEKSNNSIGIDALIGQVPQDKRSDDNGLWRVLQAVGRKVSPDNPALAAVAGTAASSMADTTMLQAQAPEDEMPDMLDLSDLGLDDDAFDLPELSSGGDSSSDSEIDFDLGDLDISGDAPAEFDLGDDFELPDFGGDDESTDDALVMAADDANELADFADSGLSLNDAAAADAALADAGSADDSGLDFGDFEAELGALEQDSNEANGGVSENADSAAMEAEFELGGLDPGGDESTDDAGLSGLDSLLAGDETAPGSGVEPFDNTDTVIMDGAVDDDLANLAASLEAGEGDSELSADFAELAAATDDEALDLGLGLDNDGLSLDGLELSSGDDELKDLEAALAGTDTPDDTGLVMDTATLVQAAENDPLSETMVLGAAVDASDEPADSTGVESSLAGADVDLEEVDTKLDLARAYLDMGDPDGARTMLDEVVVEGSTSQRQEAEGLIAQL